MATLQHTDELYHILEDEICALKILPGEALSENQLCKRFGVSRTPIRSVLQRLEQNRFVQIIPCKGTIVTAIDIGVVDQLIFQRVAVEGMVFRDFVQSRSPWRFLLGSTFIISCWRPLRGAVTRKILISTTSSAVTLPCTRTGSAKPARSTFGSR